MATSVLYMSMSLDGYIAGPNDNPDNPGGDGFNRLHEWFPPEPAAVPRRGRSRSRGRSRVRRRGRSRSRGPAPVEI